MYSIELKVDSSTYQEVMQFLAKVNVFSLKAQQLDTSLNDSNRDELIASFNEAKPMFTQIEDPIAWQKNLRDEWQ